MPKRSKSQRVRVQSEHKIIQKVIRCKGLQIPREVLVWSWFKRWILEKKEIRKQLESIIVEDISKVDFIEELLKILPKKNFPSFANTKQTKSTFLASIYEFSMATLSLNLPFEIKQTEHGLSLWTRSKIKIATDTTIVGTLCYITEDTAKKLIALKYPSLYGTSDGIGILYGPLALVNHDCGAIHSFSKPIPELGFKGFDGIKLVSPAKHLRKQKEILVQYSEDKKDLPFICHCTSCQ